MTQKVYEKEICLVTNELYPLGPGGIGRMLYNFARHNEAMGAPARLHYLVPESLVEKRDDKSRLESALGEHAMLHVAPELSTIPNALARSLRRAADTRWTLEDLLATSYSYFAGLQAAERLAGRPFDIIEFPDFGGWGLVSMEAKRAGLAFQDTLMSVRLHSSKGMIIRAEKFENPSIWNGMLIDAERHLLTHADVVVGHIPSVMQANAENYKLTDAWAGRTYLEFPPVLLEDQDLATAAEDDEAERGGAKTDFIFSSRLQVFKRPDIFIRAAIEFLERHPDHRGKFRLVSYGWDTDYIGWLQSLVPPALRPQIQFTFDATPEERDALLLKSVVVIPSDYESLCLFAIESSKMGRPVILNRTCAAFGQNDRWAEDDNCLMFDGSVEDLVTSMEKAIGWAPQSIVDATPDAPYWLKPDLIAQGERGTPEHKRPSISVVCTGGETAAEVDAQFSKAVFLERALDLESGFDELVFLLPRGRFDSDSSISSRIQARGWRLEFSSGVEECPEMLRKRLCGLERDCVLLLPTGFDMNPDFIGQSRVAMARNPELSIFGGYVEIADPSSGIVDTLQAYGGEMPSFALSSGRIAPLVSVFRKSFLERTHFEPRARSLWFEECTRRAALDGEEILIAPVIAATMDGQRSLFPTTSAKLNAGILDQFGLANGIDARLVGLEVSRLASETKNSFIKLPDLTLANARRVLPKNRNRNFDPVSYKRGTESLLVHPLENTPVTVAEIQGPGESIRRLDVWAKNASHQNHGVEAMVARVPDDARIEEVMATLNKMAPLPAGYSCSAWEFLPPGKETQIQLLLQGSSTGKDRILLMSRLPSGASEAQAHLTFLNIYYLPRRYVPV